MQKCQFEMKPSSVPRIAKQDQEVSFVMDPPMPLHCTALYSASGKIEFVRSGGKGDVTVKAKRDNADGTLFVTLKCDECDPMTVVVSIGPAANTPNPDVRGSLINAVITGLTGGIIGGFFGGPAGAFFGVGLGIVVGFFDIPLLNWILRKLGWL